MVPGAYTNVIPDSKWIYYNLLNNYAQLTIQDITSHANNFLGSIQSKGNKSFQIFHCITNPLTNIEHLKYISESIKFTMLQISVGDNIFKFTVNK